MAKRDVETPDFLVSFRPASCTPEEVERLIDLRVAQIDDQIKPHLASVAELQAERKRWITVTGGRSRNTDEPLPEEQA